MLHLIIRFFYFKQVWSVRGRNIFLTNRDEDEGRVTGAFRDTFVQHFWMVYQILNKLDIIRVLSNHFLVKSSPLR